MSVRHQPTGTARLMGLWAVMMKMEWFGEPQAQDATDYAKSPPMDYVTSHCLLHISAAKRLGEDHQNVINVRVIAYLYTISVNVSMEIALFSL